MLSRKISAAKKRFTARFLVEKNSSPLTMKPWITPSKIIVWNKRSIVSIPRQNKTKYLPFGAVASLEKFLYGEAVIHQQVFALSTV